MVTSKRWAVATVSLFALLAACGAEKQRLSESKSVVLAGALLSHDPELRARWNAMKEISSTGDEFISSGDRTTTAGLELSARMPRVNNQATNLRTGGKHFALQLNGSLPAIGALNAGKLVYRDALPNHVDRVVTATDYILEESLVLPDTSAGSTFTWGITNDTHAAAARSDGEGGLYVSEAIGQDASLHVSRPFAIDAHGVKHEAIVAWNGEDHSIRVTIPDADKLAYPVLLDPTFEVVLWHQAAALPALAMRQMVFDTWRGEVLLPGYDANYFFNGAWRAQVAEVPTVGSNYAFAFDEDHGEAVLFGGNNAGPSQDTWTWNGSKWTFRTTPNRPSARAGAVATYDPIRKKVFLFGGADSTTAFNDTWSWNGTDWTKLSPATSPTPRSGASMVFDTSKGVAILYGGKLDNSTLRADTWSFDGTTWTNLNATLAGRFNPSMAYDPVHNNVVLYGGNNTSTILSETWLLAGNTWTQVVPLNNPSAHQGAAIVFDQQSQKVVMHGGLKTTEGILQVADLDTWTWNGSDWTKIPLPAPFPRVNHTVAFDEISKRTLLYGGTADNNAGVNLKNETWAVSQGSFTLLTPSASPTAASGVGLAFDKERNQLVLFGGNNAAATALNETWVWNGSTWAKKTPAHSPPAFGVVPMAYDSVRKNIVMFGPTNASTATDAMWIWDGTDWTQPTPAHRPTARFGHTLTFDVARGKVVCFGGTDDLSGMNVSDETWTWDGTDWTLETPAAKPSGRALHSATYDSTRGLVIVWGGVSQRDTWAWDGTTWTQLGAFGPPRTVDLNTFVRSAGS